jgi:uncharacterized membrane protein
MIGVISLLLLRAFRPLFKTPISLDASQKRFLFLAVFVALLISGLYFWKGAIAPLFYPAVMSFGVASLFGGSLLFPPSLVEQLARVSEPNLSAKGVTYTRKVTIMWFVFCLTNGALSLITVFCGDLELWSLYNGCCAYVLMGCLFLGEYGIRQYCKRRAP